MKPYTASHSDIEAWLECHLQYLFRKRGAPKSAPTLYQVVGDATHEAAVEASPELRAEIIKSHVQRLPEEQREEATQRTESQLRVADEMERQAPLQDEEKEKLERWPIPNTDWVLVIKSDKIGWIEVPGGKRVLVIIDMKSGLNPAYLIYHAEIEIQDARRAYHKRVNNLKSIEGQIEKVKLEMAGQKALVTKDAKAAQKRDGAIKSLERRIEYLEGVKTKVEAQVAECDLAVRKLARKLQRLSRKLEKVRSQLFFFAMVAEQTRDYHEPIELGAFFLGDRTDEDDQLKQDRARQEATRKFQNKVKARALKGGRPFVPQGGEPDPHLLDLTYQPRAGEKALSEYVEILDDIETAFRKDDFQASPGWKCNGCDYRDSCPAFKAWSDNRLRVLNPASEGSTPKTA